MKIEAWINPYRVSYKDNFDDLSELNPAKQWYTDNPLTDDLIITGSGIYYNPSSKRAQKIIIDGVREIVKNYNISAIHMDDYFIRPSMKELMLIYIQIIAMKGVSCLLMIGAGKMLILL